MTSSRLATLLLVAAAACSSSSSPPDPTKAKCLPHSTLEMRCGDAEMQQALAMIGDMCQKVLNGKNPHIFGPSDARRMEAELACATRSLVDGKEDCAAYAACKATLDAEPAE